MKTTRTFLPDTTVNSQNYNDVRTFVLDSLRRKYARPIEENSDIRRAFESAVCHYAHATFAEYYCDEDAFTVAQLAEYIAEDFSYDVDFFG